MTQLGDALSDERRRQGKTLVEVEAATRIRSRMLEALEHGDYENLPAPAYVKGYIQSYAHYLDVPAQPLLDLYKADMRFADERADERERLGPVMPRGARYSKASRQNLEDLPAEPVVPKREQAHAIPTRTWLTIAAVIVAAFAVMWGVSHLFGDSGGTPPVPTSPAQETTVGAGAEASDTAAGDTAATDAGSVTPVSGDTSATGETSATPTSTPFTLRFRIRAGQSSSLKVTVDGATAFDGTISSGSLPPVIKVYDSARIVIGHPIWVTTYQDGKRVPTPNRQRSYTLDLTNTSAGQ